MNKRKRLWAAGLVIAATVAAAGPVPTLEATAEAAPEPVYVVPLVTIRTADSDGTRAREISDNEIGLLVKRANELFSPAGIEFRWDINTDIHDVNNTLLNNDCTIPSNVDATDKNKKPPCYETPNRNARQNWALNFHEGKVVVFFRYGNEYLEFKDGRWVTQASGTGSFSSGCFYFVAMGEYPEPSDKLPDSENLLAHELGHYFHCLHTFKSKEIQSLEDVDDKIRAYVEGPNPNRPESEGLNVFDGDGLSDTPPDPYAKLWTNEYGHKCAEENPTVTVDWTEKTGSKPYTLAPDRGQIMSGFSGCPPDDHFSDQQTALMRSSIEDLNRADLVGEQPGASHENRYEDQWPSGWTFAPFMLDGAPYHLGYNVETGDMRIDQIDEKSFRAVDTVWNYKWTKGWTSITPFTLGSKPYFLLYKKDQGEAKIVRVRARAQGTETVWSSDKWTEGWTSFMPFNSGGSPHVLIYKKDQGDVKILRIGTAGKDVDAVWSDKWAKGYTSFMPYTTGGLFGPKPTRFVIYNKGVGTVKILEIDPDAEGAEILWSDTWTTGWTSITRLSRGHQDYALLYKAGSGRVKIVRIRDDAQGYIPVWESDWSGGWTTLETFLSGPNWLLLYKQGAGTAKIERICI